MRIDCRLSFSFFCVYALACKGQSSTSGLFLNCSTLVFERESLVNLELVDPSNLADWQEILPSPPPQYWDYKLTALLRPVIHMGSGESNSDPHVCSANTSPLELSPFPPAILAQKTPFYDDTK